MENSTRNAEKKSTKTDQNDKTKERQEHVETKKNAIQEKNNHTT